MCLCNHLSPINFYSRIVSDRMPPQTALSKKNTISSSPKPPLTKSLSSWNTLEWLSAYHLTASRCHALSSCVASSHWWPRWVVHDARPLCDALDEGIHPQTPYMWQLTSITMIQKVYLRAAGLNLVAMVFYAIFASGEIQAWAVHHSYQDGNVKMSTL